MESTASHPRLSRQRLASRPRCKSGRSRCRPLQNHRRSLHRNQQYSITALTDASGAIVERYAYTAYGTPTITDASGATRTTTAVGNRYTYTGREWDETLALYHYRARMYDAVAGRFASRDPIGYKGGPGLYLGIDTNTLDWNGRVRSKLVRSPRMGLGSCSKMEITWRVSSDPGEHFIVQKICFQVNQFRCFDESGRNAEGCCRPYTRVRCEVCYYELLVDPDESGYEDGEAEDDWELDLPKLKGDCGSNGTFSISSEIRAYPKTVPVQIGKRNGPKPNYLCGRLVTIQANEDSSQTEPTWWNQHSSSIERLARYKWQCCAPNAPTTFSTVEVGP